MPRFFYFWREKVSAWELSDDSCSAFVRTQIVGKTKFFDSLTQLVGETPVSRQLFLLLAEDDLAGLRVHAVHDGERLEMVAEVADGAAAVLEALLDRYFHYTTV